MPDVTRLLSSASFDDETFQGASNKLAGARVPVEAAIRMAEALGLEIIGA